MVGAEEAGGSFRIRLQSGVPDFGNHPVKG